MISWLSSSPEWSSLCPLCHECQQNNRSEARGLQEVLCHHHLLSSRSSSPPLPAIIISDQHHYVHYPYILYYNEHQYHHHTLYHHDQWTMNIINTIMIIDAITMLLPRSPHNPPIKQVWHLSFKVCGKKDNLIKSKPELHQLELNLTRNSWFRTSQRFQCTIVRCQRK